MKRTLSVIAVLLVSAGILFAAGAQQGGGSASTAKTYVNGAPVSAADPIDVAKYPYSVAEPMTITIFDVAANKMGDQTGWFGDVVKRRFNVTLNIIAPQTQGIGLYQSRAASGYLGDIVLLDPADFQESIAAGLVDDLTEEFQSTTYLKQYADQYNYWNKQLEGNTSGKIYGFPTEITNTGVDKFTALNADNAPRIAWDYFQGVGAPAMKDENDLLNTIKAIVDKYPTSSVNGGKTYGVELWPDWDGANYLEPAVQSMKWFGYNTDPAYNSMQIKYDGSYTDLLDPNGGYLRAVKFYNKAWQMGLLDPDSQTQTWEGGMVPKMTNKQVVLLMYSWQNGFWNTPAKDIEGVNYMYVPVDDLTFYQPGDSYYGTIRVFGVGKQNGRELDPSKKERVMALMDWLASPECLTFQHNGLPVESYTVNPNGTYTLTDWGASALMNNLPTPAAWGVVGYNDGLSMINQWFMSTSSTSPLTGEPYATNLWSSTLATAQASKTTKEWAAKYGYADEVKYMVAKGQMSPVPNLTPVFGTDSTDIQNIRAQTGPQVRDYSWRMVYANTDAEYDALLAQLKSTLAGLGWDQLVANDKVKTQQIATTWANAK
jgi:multiple sugar transport system substrate-binding protein/putative aldouronate transport system substrate-binding protein